MLDNQFMKRDVLMPVPEAKESSSSTRPGLFVLLFFFWTVLAQFAVSRPPSCIDAGAYL